MIVQSYGANRTRAFGVPSTFGYMVGSPSGGGAEPSSCVRGHVTTAAAMNTEITLPRAEAKAFYDRFGAKQDKQGWYEDPPVARLIAHADFGAAKRVVELGCGTGRLAAKLIGEALPKDASYLALDLSATMAALATERLAGFGPRAQVKQTDGAPVLPVADASVDRVVSTYVLDLLPVADIAMLVADAHRALAPGGKLCLVGLTHGERGLSTLVSRFWSSVFRKNPAKVGGCRPLRMSEHLPRERWRIDHREVVTAWAIPSEVVVASPSP